MEGFFCRIPFTCNIFITNYKIYPRIFKRITIFFTCLSLGKIAILGIDREKFTKRNLKSYHPPFPKTLFEATFLLCF
jgi:hypothetical protein